MWLYSSIEGMKSVMDGFNWQNKINCDGRGSLFQQDREITHQYGGGKNARVLMDQE